MNFYSGNEIPLTTMFCISALIPVRFSQSNYLVREEMDSSAVITLEALEDHPDFPFNLTVVALDGTATRGSSHRYAFVGRHSNHARLAHDQSMSIPDH